MPASTSVAEASTTTSRTKIHCASASIALLLVVMIGALSRGVCALRMINLDASEKVFSGDTIQLSCYYALQTVSGSDQADQTEGTRHLPAVISGDGQQKSGSIQNGNSQVEELFKSGSIFSPTNRAPRQKSRSLRMLDSKQVSSNELSGAISEQLYVIKWYKDGHEFFRYLAQGSPKKQWLPMDGVIVDVDRSNNQTVFLRNVSLKTSGHFRCEVSTDAPNFVTKSIERKILVYTQPSGGPSISLIAPTKRPTSRTGSNIMAEYFFGDRVDILCSTPESKPATVIDWIINDSLNLSASSSIPVLEEFEQWPVIEVNNKQLVRLLAPINSSIGERIAADIRTQALQLQVALNPLTAITYELIQNNTKAIPYQAQQHPPTLSNHLLPKPISVAESTLNQLLELSISRLNFTIDTNLLQRLNLTAGKNSRRPEKFNSMIKLREIKTRLSSSQGTIETVGEERFLSTGDPIPYDRLRNDSTSLSEAKRIRTRRLESKHLSLLNSSSKAGWVKSTPISHTHPAKEGRFAINNQKLLLKIECVARFIHWNMSDAIKIQVYSKTKKDIGADSNVVIAQKRQRVNEKNSGKTKSIDYMMQILRRYYLQID